jgi:serine/threonine protein phosphatase PrpC
MVKTMFRSAGLSDPGRVRQNNEDAFHVDAERGIFLVVDGIGGQAAGEKAAEIAVNRIRARLERQTGTLEQRIREAIAMANNEIYKAAQENPEWRGMACVLTVAVLENGSAVVGHVGDSRLYHLRRGSIRKVTHDHSPVGEREDAGEIGEAEAMRHPRRNEVFRDVGSEEHAPDDANFIELQRIPFEPDAALLICSDGLSDLVASAEIRQAIERNAGDPDAAARALVAAANEAGGKDNVTVVVVEGEQFTAPAVPDREAPASRGVGSIVAAVLATLAIAAAALYFTRDLWMPKPVVIRPRTLVVGKDAPYDTIAAAIAAAQPGDTVDVLPGEYREGVQLKTDVTVKSSVPREAVLRLPVPQAQPTEPVAAAQSVQRARLAGFHILMDEQDPPATAILVVDSSVIVDQVDIERAGIGIDVRGGSDVTLIGNAIHDCRGEGLLLSGPVKASISHNSFQRNKGGIVARDGARPALVGNVFEKNPIVLPPEIPMDTVREHNFILDAQRPTAHGKKKE